MARRQTAPTDPQIRGLSARSN